MEEKKIATSVDILINIDRFEHFQITKYAEKKITYENKEEMIQKEDQLTNELLSDIRRSLKLSFDGFSGISKEIDKKMEPVSKVEEKIGKKMPSWLEDGPVPNIANAAKKSFDKSVSESYVKSEDNRIKAEENKVTTEDFLEGKQAKEEPKKESKEEVKPEDKPEEKDVDLDSDLFSDDEDLFK